MQTLLIPPTQGTIYTVGYAASSGPATIDRLMRSTLVRLIDIRKSPRSRWYPTFNKAALETRFNADQNTYPLPYRWEPRLGNLHYQERDLGIKLAPGHEDALQELAREVLAGTSLIFLCACANSLACHRTLVAKLLQDTIQTLQQEGQSR